MTPTRGVVDGWDLVSCSRLEGSVSWCLIRKRTLTRTESELLDVTSSCRISVDSLKPRVHLSYCGMFTNGHSTYPTW